MSDTLTVSAPAGLPFRLEMMGAPGVPYLVHDEGRRDLPYDPSSMRSAAIDVNFQAEFHQLWEAYENSQSEISALRAAIDARDETIVGLEAKVSGTGGSRGKKG